MTGRSAGWRWLAAAKACAINSVTISNTGVGRVRGRYSDMASVSLSH